MSTNPTLRDIKSIDVVIGNIEHDLFAEHKDFREKFRQASHEGREAIMRTLASPRIYKSWLNFSDLRRDLLRRG